MSTSAWHGLPPVTPHANLYAVVDTARKAVRWGRKCKLCACPLTNKTTNDQFRHQDHLF